MRLYSFRKERYASIAAEHGGRLVDLGAAYDAMKASGMAPEGPPLDPIMWVFLRRGDAGLELARRAIRYAASGGGEEPQGGRRGRRAGKARQMVYDFAEVSLLAPVPHPRKVLCCGVNYSGRLEDPGEVPPESPVFFAKLPNAITGPGQHIVLPAMSAQVDYGVTLAAVLGRRGRNIPEDETMAYVAGYTILHDVIARDVELRDQQPTLGRNFDTFAPIGPCIVTPDELPDPGNVRLRTLLNGAIMQDASTCEWIFPLPRLLSSLSRVMTLEPGDIVSTGTPAGAGLFRDPQVFLKPGDTVVLEAEGIGRLENPVAAEE